MSFCKCDSPHCTDASVKRERPDLDSLAAGIAADILDSQWFRERDARIKAEAWDDGYRVGREDERTKDQFIRFTEDNPYRSQP